MWIWPHLGENETETEKDFLESVCERITMHSWDSDCMISAGVSMQAAGPQIQKAVVGHIQLQYLDNHDTVIICTVGHDFHSQTLPRPTSWNSRTFHAARNRKFLLECMQQELQAGPRSAFLAGI